MDTNNRLLLKNSGMLYLRMFIALIISLFTSREILRILGVVDYGVYSVVGNVITMFSFLNNAMGGSTSRFLTYEIGTSNLTKQIGTFTSACIIHLGIAIFVILLGETIGLWFVLNKLNIPESSRFAANIVYQLSIVSTVISITQVPYNAVLIAHEKMDIFAYVEIANIALKLLILYLLFVIPGNKLIVYSVLVLCASLLIAIIYRFVAYKLFVEVRGKLTWRWNFIKPMLSYSSWELYGHLTDMIRSTGIVMILNVFFGAIVNAAGNIAMTIQGVVMGFGINITTSLKPQIIKSYASNDYIRTQNLLFLGVKISFLVIYIIALPLIINMQFVLEVWLHEVPEYTTVFCKLVLVYNVFAVMSVVVANGCNATGKIKRQNFINGSLYLMVLPISYFAFSNGSSPYIPYIFNVGAVLIGMLNNAYTCYLYIPNFSFRKYFFSVFLRCLVIAVTCYILVMSISIVLPLIGWSRMIVTSIISIFIVLICGWRFLLSLEVRKYVISYIKIRIK